MIQETQTFSNNDIWHMGAALQQAEIAFSLGEVPVGAVIVNSENKIIAKAHNVKESNNDPCGHAEILVIREAAKKMENWRLTGCRLYVTLEPCVMCMGAIVQSRLETLVFGAYDPKGGALSNGFNIHDSKALNHRFSLIGGVEHYSCSNLLSSFFKQRRLFYKK